MIALKLLALAAWGRLKSGLSALLSLAGRYPLQAALIVALVACGWLWRGKSSALAERDEARAELLSRTEKFKAAQAAADLAQRQADAANEALQDERNRITAYVARNAETARRSAVDRYADRMRIASDCRPAIAPGVPENPGKPDGETEGGDLVAITRADLDALTQDAVQGAVRYEWLKSLVDSGQAVVVPDVEFGGE